MKAHGLTTAVLLTLAAWGGVAEAELFEPTRTVELIAAIETANTNGADDVIDLSGLVFTLLTVHNGEFIGPNGLPPISVDGGSSLTVRNGIIERSEVGGTPLFRLVHVEPGADLRLEEVTLRRGAADELFNDGGAIWNQGWLSVTESTVSGNSAELGGGIMNDGELTITESTVSGNSALHGGGIRNAGALTITESIVSGNSATLGAGILNDGTLTMTMSTVRGNSGASLGGGIDNDGELTITNSTVSGNSAHYGGGISNGGALTLVSTTVTGNAATFAGGGLREHGGGATTTYKASIVARNFGDTSNDCAPEVGMSSEGFNVVGAGCPNVPGDIVISDPMLGPLQDNGGPTWTHAALPGSPAIDRHDLEDADCAGTDQRGVLRRIDGDGDGSDEDFDGGCDSGAFEAAGLGPENVEVDVAGNGVLEPGEAVDVAPAWRNDGVTEHSPTGTASEFTGPAGANHSLIDDAADYGAIAPGATASCLDTGDCYEMGVDNPAPRRRRLRGAEQDRRMIRASSLSDAAFTGDIARVRALLAAGADPDVPATDGRTPLLHAILGGQLEAAQALLTAGAGVETRGTEGATALLTAVLLGHWDAVAMLLRYGADPDAGDGDGLTPRRVAAIQGDAQMRRLFDEMER